MLSARQVEPLLRTRGQEEAVPISFDLGRSVEETSLTAEGVCLPDGRVLRWENVEEIASDPDACWLVDGASIRKIHAFSEQLQRSYSLLPTRTAPTLINSGFTMHRIKRSDPMADTANKIRAAAPVRGNVLDTTTGLGYTAIAAARTANAVTTIEIDSTVLEIARLNPWSRELFDNPKISQLVGDSFELVREMPEACFDLIIHDPPSFSLAGELYSGAFYRDIFRLLRPGGRLFHYLGNPESRQGQTVTKGATRRLREAGFTSLMAKPEAFGLVARKEK